MVVVIMQQVIKHFLALDFIVVELVFFLVFELKLIQFLEFMYC